MWAVSSLQRGDIEVARRRFSEVARLERPGSEAHASALLNLGELEYAIGHLEAARTAARQAKDTYAAHQLDLHGLVLSNLAAYAMAADDLDEARTHLYAALELQPKSGRAWLAGVIEARALLAALLADYERAASLAGFSDALYRARGECASTPSARGYERLMRRLAEVYSAEDIASRMEAGGRMSEKEALALASAIHQ